MYLCRLGTDEQARGPLPAQKTSLAIHVEFARQFLAFPCSTRCVRCACQVPNSAAVARSSQDPFNILILRSYFRSESKPALLGQREISAQNCSGLQTGLPLAEIVVG